jgi:hypothetical protein
MTELSLYFRAAVRFAAARAFLKRLRQADDGQVALDVRFDCSEFAPVAVGPLQIASKL